VVGQRDVLATVLQANGAVIPVEQNDIGVRQNETTKQLAIIATIFLPLSFITGFFGMNFGWLTGHGTSLWVFLGNREPGRVLRHPVWRRSLLSSALKDSWTTRSLSAMAASRGSLP
jgi:CorA-like Mg2+ transporter protein